MIDRDLVLFYERLSACGIATMVVGSIASSTYGEPRTTLDIDLVVAATPDDAERLHSAFPPDRYYVPPIDVVRRELRRGAQGAFNIIDGTTSLKADIYPCGGDELMTWGLANRQSRQMAGIEVAVAPATYVVAMKLRYFAMSRQEKHLRDIRGILSLSRREVDSASVDRWAEAAGVLTTWRDCQGRVGEG